MTKVSVIMPVYNAEQHLEECLASVLRQAIHDVEVICVNDGSTDGSLEVLRRLARQDARVRVIDQPNRGAAFARNVALDVAQGECIAFMDSDDRYSSAGVLSALYESMKRKRVKMCGGRMRHFDGEGKIFELPYPPFFGFTTFLFARELFSDGGVRFPNYRLFEDPPFLVSAMARAGVVEQMNLFAYDYRVVPRPPVDWAGSAAEKAKDALRGMIDVVRLAREAGMESISTAMDEYCRGNDVRVIAGRLSLRDAAAMELLCQLNAEVGGPLLPVLDEIRKVALAGSSPYSSMCHLLRLIKQAVGRHVPDGVKFWR